MSRLARQAAVLAAGALVAASGCGGGGKPGYCSDRAALEQSIKDLTKLSPSNGISGVKAQLQRIQSDANALVASAKSDFPSETSAIKSSIDTLASAIKALPSNPSPSDVAPLAADASNVVSAVRGFADATDAKCS